jgi:hypothetical protein
MGDLLYIAGLVVAYIVVKSLSPEMMTRVVMTVLGKSGLEKVGRKALETQPDRITLEPKADPPAQPLAATALRTLERRGFDMAGGFRIAEMAGVVVHFLVKDTDAAVAVVYEHPKAGVWCDLYSRYRDGTSFTVTSAPAGGSLEERPGHPSVRAPGQPPAMLHARLLNERPAGELQSIPASAIAHHFAQAYAESTAWRKQRGISAQEVRGAALERVG